MTFFYMLSQLKNGREQYNKPTNNWDTKLISVRKDKSRPIINFIR